ncbi:MAG: Holliday junction resolvase Hjc [Archaeoglobaceae archaeon]
MPKKGMKFERDLIHMFWNKGYAALRTAGSGAARYPTPDVVAGNGSKFIALEVKKRSSLPVYLTENEVRELVMFSNLFGADAFIAVKIPRKEWKFVDIEQLKKGKSYRVDEEVYSTGIDFESIIEV